MEFVVTSAFGLGVLNELDRSLYDKRRSWFLLH